MTSESKSAFARRHSVNRSTVNKWEARGHLVMTVDGLVNVEGSEKLLTMRPVIYRGGQAKGPVAPEAPRQVDPVWDPSAQSEPVEVIIAALSAIVREIGGRAARRAVEFGASLRTAYAIDVAVCLDAGEISERFLASIGTPVANNTSMVEIADTGPPGIIEADWPALAQAAGELLDLPALKDWFFALPNFDPPKVTAHV